MKQIKTIYERTAFEFDKKVNDALLSGWKLARRSGDKDVGFLAELEKKVKAEANCQTCEYVSETPTKNPCKKCLLSWKRGKGKPQYREAGE